MTIHGWPLPNKVMWQGAFKGAYGLGGTALPTAARF